MIASAIRRGAAPVLLSLVGSGTPNEGLADDATVLPAGVSRAYADFYRYLPTTQRYNRDGDREELAFQLTNAPLDSSVLASLQPLDPLVGGTATIGNVAVAYEYDISVLDLGFSYGLTERLTVGFHLPYYWITNHVATSFDSASANVGLNPATGTCCIPIAAGGQPMGEGDVQNLIRDQFGFSRIETWRRQGIGDLELGGKYQLSRTEDTAWAVTGGLRVATGYADDADDLTDVAWSYGNHALLLRLHYDYKLSNLWSEERTPLRAQAPVPGDVVMNATLRYDYMLPDKQIKRIGDDPDQILTANRERVERKLGDLFGLEVSGSFQLSESIAVTALYNYASKRKDDISGTMGFNYESLEAHTDSSQHIAIVRAR